MQNIIEKSRKIKVRNDDAYKVGLNPIITLVANPTVKTTTIKIDDFKSFPQFNNAITEIVIIVTKKIKAIYGSGELKFNGLIFIVFWNIDLYEDK